MMTSHHPINSNEFKQILQGKDREIKDLNIKLQSLQEHVKDAEKMVAFKDRMMKDMSKKPSWPNTPRPPMAPMRRFPIVDQKVRHLPAGISQSKNHRPFVGQESGSAFPRRGQFLGVSFGPCTTRRRRGDSRPRDLRPCTEESLFVLPRET